MRKEQSFVASPPPAEVDSLQKSMSIFDSLVRKAREILARQCNSVLDQEIEERTKEYRRLWDAIDTHTHDLSTQASSCSLLGYYVFLLLSLGDQ